MTEVKFFYNVEDKLRFACDRAQKAVQSGLRLLVFCPDTHQAEAFDRLLWTFAPLSFVPHVPARHELAATTPVVIATADDPLPHHEALLNLGNEPPPFFSRFDQLREIVSTDPEDRQFARQRRQFYKARGFAVEDIDCSPAKRKGAVT